MDNDEDIPSSRISRSTEITPTPTHSAARKPGPGPPTTFHLFLDLPLEIRRIIYRYELAKPNPIISLCSNSGFGLGTKEPHGPIVDISLLATSKAIHEEAKTEFLMYNTIRLNDINVCKLKTTEGQRNTIRDARHLTILFQPNHHRNFYKDARVFEFEFPRFRHLETLHLILFHAVDPCPNDATYHQVGAELNEWAKLWVEKRARIEWRDTSARTGIPKTPAYLKEQEKFARYLAHVEGCMVKGERPKWIRYLPW